MFAYCLPEIFSKFNLWLKSDVDNFLLILNDPKHSLHSQFLNKIFDSNSNSNLSKKEIIENLIVEIDFCKNFLDSE